jgi:hypothetical protein
MITKTLLLVMAVLFSVIRTTAQPYRVFFGNLHAHTSYSDGAKDRAQTNVKTPLDAFLFARESEHLDFLGISEHNHSQAGMQLANYAKGLAEANSANEDGRFVALYGMEYGVISKGGHVVIYGSDKLVGWEPGNYDVYSAKSDYNSLFNILSADRRIFATLAHPAQADYGNLAGRPYDLKADQAVCGVAISSGPAFSKKTDYSDKAPISFLSYYKRLLSLGYIVGPVIDHDNHNTTFGRMSASRTAVLARSLNRDSIIDAYRTNRFYATQDWNAVVDFTVNGQPMGSYLKTSSQLALQVHINDPDSADKVKSIKFLYGKPGTGEPAKVLTSNTNQPELTYAFAMANGDAYYFYVEIVQQDGDRIYTSPIWAKL